MSGNSSVETLLKDAEKLVTRLKSHEKAADCLLGQADGLHKTIKAKSSYMKEISALNEVARHRPRSELVLGIQMENQQIRRLQAENRDLRMLIDEHQSAVDVIMTKYREQMALIVAAKKMNRNGTSQNQAFLDNALHRKRCKIDELASVMGRAIDLDEGVDDKSERIIEKLKTENRVLRETLRICEKKQMEGIVDAVGKEDIEGVAPAATVAFGGVVVADEDVKKAVDEIIEQVKTESEVEIDNKSQNVSLDAPETAVAGQLSPSRTGRDPTSMLESEIKEGVDSLKITHP